MFGSREQRLRLVLFEDPGDKLRVDGGGDLVEHKNLGVGCRSTGYGDSLLLPPPESWSGYDRENESIPNTRSSSIPRSSFASRLRP